MPRQTVPANDISGYMWSQNTAACQVFTANFFLLPSKAKAASGLGPSISQPFPPQPIPIVLRLKFPFAKTSNTVTLSEENRYFLS
jgi:hypothetical protein